MSINVDKFIGILENIESITELENFLKANKDVILRIPKLKLQIGHQFKKLNKFDYALKLYTDYYQTEQCLAGLWFRGMLHQKTGDFCNAIVDYVTIIQTDGNSKYMEFLLLFLAKCYVEDNKYSEARDCLNLLKDKVGESEFVTFQAYCGGNISTSAILAIIE